MRSGSGWEHMDEILYLRKEILGPGKTHFSSMKRWKAGAEFRRPKDIRVI